MGGTHKICPLQPTFSPLDPKAGKHVLSNDYTENNIHNRRTRLSFKVHSGYRLHNITPFSWALYMYFTNEITAKSTIPNIFSIRLFRKAMTYCITSIDIISIWTLYRFWPQILMFKSKCLKITMGTFLPGVYNLSLSYPWTNKCRSWKLS